MSWAQVFNAYDETDLIAICDLDGEKRDQAREQLGVESLYESFDEFVSDERLDAVALFTPAPLHAEQSIKAITAGKHVLCAVPAVMETEEAKSLVEAASQSDRIYMMAENPDYLWRNGQKVMLEGNRNGQGDQYTHDLFTQEALDYIEQEKNSPFFLYLAYTLPHAELTVPEDSQNSYLGKFPEKPFEKKREWRPGVYSAQENPKAAFAGMISRLDRDVGRLLTKLEELGLDRDTLVMFTSDNGPHREGGADPYFFGGSGPLRGIKRDLYEGGIRIPFIARWPEKIESGSTSDHVSAFWDILPTCAELAGTNAPEEIDGLSMVPCLFGRAGEQEKHAHLYWEFKEKQAVRLGDWKGVRPEGEDGQLELYDLKSDISEQQDLSRRHPEITARIKKILETSHDVPRRSPRTPRTQ